MSTSTDATPSTRHADQGFLVQWHTFEIDGDTIVVQDREGPEVAAYRVVGTTRDVLRLRWADAALYEGSVVEPWWDEDRRLVRLCHHYAGDKDALRVTEWLDEPAVLLEELDSGDVTEAIEG